MTDERLRPWRTVASRRIIDNRYLRVRADTVELPDGTHIDDYFVRETLGFCVICAVTTDERIVLVRQYKYGADTVVRELPAGMIDPGESPDACAVRELREETGYTSPRFEHVRSFLTEPTGSNGRFHLYLARDAANTHPTQFDPSEHIITELVTIDELRALLRGGAIETGAQVAACWTALDVLARLTG